MLTYADARLKMHCNETFNITNGNCTTYLRYRCLTPAIYLLSKLSILRCVRY